MMLVSHFSLTLNVLDPSLPTRMVFDWNSAVQDHPLNRVIKSDQDIARHVVGVRQPSKYFPVADQSSLLCFRLEAKRQTPALSAQYHDQPSSG